MDRKKRMIKYYYIVCAMLTFTSIFLLRYKIVIGIKNAFFNKEVSSLNLTHDEKMADFEEFYSNIIKSVPLLDDQAKMYGISFKDRKDYYIELIEKTQDDYEFFCTMAAIEEDIPSFHTDICFPLYSNISNLGGYNVEKILCGTNFKSITEYWYKCIGNAYVRFSEVQRTNFKYIDGEYLFDAPYSSEQYQNFQGYTLVSIDGKRINDYVVSNVSTYKIYYDYVRDIPYRWYLTLNDRVGEKVKVTLKDSDGNTINTELYFDFQIEVIDAFSYYYEDDATESKGSSIYYYSDFENGIGYVDIENFLNSNGKELEKILKSMGDFDNIVIDLRGNYGGYRKYAQRYLYQAIYSDDVETTLNWFIPSSDLNKIINNNLKNKLFYQSSSDKDGCNYSRKYIYRGKAADNKQSVYYLIDRGTASAADGYVAMIKENKLGTLIGSNTSGEGIADSYCCDSLKNSGLVYIYSPSLSYNQNGTNNSIYGTSPDIYTEQTKDSFYLQREMQAARKDINLYTEMLKYDTALIKTIEIIQQKSNLH